jgi:hypothetical protein
MSPAYSPPASHTPPPARSSTSPLPPAGPRAGGGEVEGVRARPEPGGPSRLAGRGAMPGGMEEVDTTEVKEDEDEWAEMLGK